jgi:Lrp/AsnC family transcriptional regulator for asnA, asnC and gidA
VPGPRNIRSTNAIRETEGPKLKEPERPTGWHGLTARTLDPYDRQLVRSLQNDGRNTITQMAREIGLSYAATRQRLQKLLEDGVLRINVVTHPHTHGYRRQALVSIRTNKNARKIAEIVGEIPEAFYVAHCVGNVDVVAELIARDDAHLAELIETVRAIDGVTSTETVLYVELTKWAYLPEFLDPETPVPDDTTEED